MNFLKKLLHDWPDFITLPIAAILWCISPTILRAWDSTAGVFDAGVLQIFLFGLIGLCFANFITWMFLKLNFPTIDRWTDNGFMRDWSSLEAKDRIKYFICVFLGLLFAFVLFCRVL